MEITSQQADRLTRAHTAIGGVLHDLGLMQEPAKAPVQPKWLADTGKQWGLLNALATDHKGDVSAEEWSRLGRQHGYDPRGLGGFFVGSTPLMASEGDRRKLTSDGRRFIERWRGDFGTNGK
jgi:hypothetical protein